MLRTWDWTTEYWDVSGGLSGWYLPQRSYCLGYHLNTNKLLCNTGRSQTYLLRYTYEILGNDGLVIVGESVLCLFQSLCSGNDF